MILTTARTQCISVILLLKQLKALLKGLGMVTFINYLLSSYKKRMFLMPPF